MIMAVVSRFAVKSRLARSLAVASLFAAGAAQPAAAGDLVYHDGFDACWSKAISKTQFTDLMKSAIDGATTCVAQSSGACGPGCTYTACNTAACPASAVGCPVTLHANSFGGTFAAGTSSFSALGSADNVTIPVTSTYGPCTISVTNISLSYELDYTMQADGGNGLYASSLDFTLMKLNPGYVVDGSNAVCDAAVTLTGSSLVSQVEAAGSGLIASLEAPDTVGETVCPAP
jgi:hypothetical protein